MKQFLSLLLTFLVTVASEPPSSKNYLSYSHWPPSKSAKQTALPKTKTLMVQIRSDHPVPLVFKGRPGSTHHNLHGPLLQYPLATSYAQSHMGIQRRPRPIKLTAPAFLKTAPLKQVLRQSIKYKVSNIKAQKKPITANYDKPYKYEKPILMSYHNFENELPTTTKANFISEHFAPIHTIPAPNLAQHDNHIHHDEAQQLSSPALQSSHQLSLSSYKNSHSNNNHNNNNNYNNHLDNHYQVLEEITNDATFIDPFSDSQKLFAPDPDPSLPTSKVRPVTEPYNQPSNGKPLPSDVQSNHLTPVQSSVQILGAQQAKLTASDIYTLAVNAQQQQLQPFISQHLTAIQAAPLSNYNPTYLVTQSNNLYTQHKKQLFQPHVSSHPPNLVDSGFNNADLTQEVASDGQILQAAKHARKNFEQSPDTLPQFAALIAAPALGAEHAETSQIAPFSLPNVASVEPQGGFVISNYYNNGVQDNSQLLQAYAEEEAQRQHLQAQQAAIELHQQQQQQEQLQQQLQQEQLQHEQATIELHQQQHHQQHFQQQQLQQHQLQHGQAVIELQHQQQQQQHLQQQQQLQQTHENVNLQSQKFIQEQHSKNVNPATAAFEEHQRLVQQHLGSDTPLRIFVPDEDEARFQKRSDKETQETDA